MYKKYMSIALISSLCYANEYFNIGKNDFFSTSKRGWHYFEKDDVNKSVNLEERKKEIDKQDEVFMSSIPLNSLENLTAEEFTQTFEKARKIATMKPTKENVAILQKMNKWQLEQSEKFAMIWQVNLLENPNLEFPELASDKFGRNDALIQRDKKVEQFFKSHKDNLAFVVFMSKFNENTNIKQKDIYDTIKRQYDVTVEYIDVDIRKDLIKTFKLETTPENFFIYKNSKGEAIWKRIRAGLSNKDDIINNTIFLFENAILEGDK
ncbi:conjugal transfer protein TraF [Campylobacter sp. MIT 97-5078]|uniref:conjugal transfer protein TraF n=2 Tax=Campylobacter sp. MIT 97-5078 TaxID=1548153 RepID=UPI000B10D018|nr:conjugal transfer protein TraF [Campylobacter sp. MIT 97-5078]